MVRNAGIIIKKSELCTSPLRSENTTRYGAAHFLVREQLTELR